MTPHEDDLLREIGASLAVEPSPGFAAGVRDKVERRRRRGRRWWLAVPVPVAAAAVLVVSVLPDARNDNAILPATTVAVVPVSSAAARVAPPSTMPVMTSASARRQVVRTPSAEEGDLVPVTVVTNQMALLRDMWARVSGATVEQVVEAPSGLVSRAPPLEVAPVVIEPVVIVASGGRPPAGAPTIKRAVALAEPR